MVDHIQTSATPICQGANSPVGNTTQQDAVQSTTTNQPTITTPPPRPPAPRPPGLEPTAKVREIASSIEAFIGLLPVLTEFPEAIRDPDAVLDNVEVLGLLITEGLNYFANLIDWEVVQEGFAGGVIEWGERDVGW